VTPSDRSSDELDLVLADFEKQCPMPTAEQIVEWQERYPKFAIEISDFGLGLQMLSNERTKHRSREPTAEEIEKENREAVKKLREVERRAAERDNQKNRN
jgi:hypothetical protein